MRLRIINTVEPHSNRTHTEDAAFERLFNQYYATLCGFAYRFVKEEDIAKDVVQNVFIRYHATLPSQEITSSAAQYLYKAVYHECLNELRNHKTRQRHIQAYADTVDSTYFDHAVEQNERERQIYLAIESLPEKCREIFMLSRVHGKKNNEIADTLHISVRTVETHISLALRKLKKTLLLCFLLVH